MSRGLLSRIFIVTRSPLPTFPGRVGAGAGVEVLRGGGKVEGEKSEGFISAPPTHLLPDEVGVFNTTFHDAMIEMRKVKHVLNGIGIARWAISTLGLVELR